MGNYQQLVHELGLRIFLSAKGAEKNYPKTLGN
jgi:hypothetical protein